MIVFQNPDFYPGNWHHLTEDRRGKYGGSQDFSLTINREKLSSMAFLISSTAHPVKMKARRGYFDMIGLPYTTWRTKLTSAITMNKGLLLSYRRPISLSFISPSPSIWKTLKRKYFPELNSELTFTTFHQTEIMAGAHRNGAK